MTLATAIAPVERPYTVRHRGDGYVLLEGDAAATLSTFAPASVDLVFSDPPYNLSNGGTTCRSGRRASVNKGRWDRSNGLDADHAFHRAWLAACQRVLRPSGTLWVSGTQHCIFSIGWSLQQLGFHLLNVVTWAKPNPPPNLGCRTFTHSTEILLWAAPRPSKPLRHHFDYAVMKRANGGKQMRDVWTIPPPSKAEKGVKGHSCQKPIKLLDRIIRASSKPGDVVLDPFNGSGTTGVVARQLGRQYIGIDVDGDLLDSTFSRMGGSP